MEKNYVSHLECSITGKKYEANKIHGLSDAGRPLLVRYDLQTLKKEGSGCFREDFYPSWETLFIGTLLDVGITTKPE